MTITEWSVSAHARQRMAERAVAASELVELLEAPERTLPPRDGVSVWTGYGILAVLDETAKTVITVGIDGASKVDWSVYAMERARAALTPRTAVEDLLKVHEADKTTKAARRRRQRRTAAPVTETHMLDGAAESLRRTAERHVSEGKVPGNYANLHVVRPGVIEYDVA